MKKDSPVFWPSGKPDHQPPAPVTLDMGDKGDVDPVTNEERVRYRKNAAGGQLAGAPDATEKIQATAALEHAIHDACRTHGILPEDFIVAHSHHGSWLVHFTTSARRQRLVWNGKDGRLVLQAALRSGGWEDLRDTVLTADADASAFATGIAGLLGTGTPG